APTIGANASRMIRTIPVVTGIAFVPAVATWYVTDEIYTRRHTEQIIGVLNEPWPPTDELVAYLRDKIGLRNTAKFRGMIFLRPYFDYQSQLVLNTVWGNFIPSLNLYNTFEDPTFAYFFGHLPLPPTTTRPVRAPS